MRELWFRTFCSESWCVIFVNYNAVFSEIENEINEISVYELDDEIIQNEIVENFVSHSLSSDSN